MANLKSAKKSIRVSARRKSINLKHKNLYKSYRKEVLDLLKAGQIKKSAAKLSKAYKEIDKAAKIGIIHKNTAARYKSRLASVLNTTKTEK